MEEIRKDLFNLSNSGFSYGLEEQREQNFYNFPSTEPMALIYESLGANTEGLAKFAKRKHLINGSANLSVAKGDKGTQTITYNSKKNKIEITLPDLEQLTVSSAPVKKLFSYAIIELCKNCIGSSGAYKDTFTVSTKDMVEAGLYTTIQAAKRALLQAKAPLMALQVGQEEYKGKDLQSFAAATLFPTITLNNKGEARFRINPDIDWGQLTQFWTKLPVYFFSLSQKAQDLLLYIHITARRTKETDGGQIVFTIPYRTIQTVLHLPSETTIDPETKKLKWIKNALRDIKDPIDQAITQIEDANKKQFTNTSFKASFFLTPVVDDNLPIKEWLDTGKLQVKMLGDYARPILQIAENRQKKIEAAIKRKEKREDTAAVELIKEEKKAAKEAASAN